MCQSTWHMDETFAQKFERALEERKEREPGYGLRTLARELATKPDDVETIRRRLHKYRPRPGGGAAQVTPSTSTRWEIEKALGLERDALKGDEVSAAAEFVSVLMPTSVFDRLIDERIEQKLGRKVAA